MKYIVSNSSPPLLTIKIANQYTQDTEFANNKHSF